MRQAGHVACVRDEKCLQISGQKTWGGRPLGRLRCT